MKLPILSKSGSLCDQCVALCCRYFAFEIDKPTTRRDFEDLRWYMLHDDVLIFVEEGEWYIQINRKCKALLPDNRCAIYENRPSICRQYTTDHCDWHAEEYHYDHLFTEPEQIAAFAKEYLAKKRRQRGRRATQSGTRRAHLVHHRKARALARDRSSKRKKAGSPVTLLRSA